MPVSLVVEHDVRSPDLVGGNSDELNPVKLCWDPSQLIIIPNLVEKERGGVGLLQVPFASKGAYFLNEYLCFIY